MIKPYRKPSRWGSKHPVTPLTSTLRACSIQTNATLAALLLSQRATLLQCGYTEIPEREMPVTICDKVLRDLANSRSLLCKRFAVHALRLMKLIRHHLPGILPQKATA